MALKPELAVAISRILEFNNPLPDWIWLGSYLLFELSDGESTGLLNIPAEEPKTTTSLSAKPVNCASPKSWSAITFLRLLEVVFKRVCLLVTQTSIRVICTRLSIKG